MVEPESPVQSGAVRLGAVGDLLLTGVPDSQPRAFGPEIARLLDGCDVVLGNLECTLPGTGETVSTEPRVVADPDAVQQMLAGRFDVVTVANNHAFDCLASGFHATRALLDRLGIAWFGAGDTLAEAARPALVEMRGVRLAFVAAVDGRSGPARFATGEGWGVAPLDVPRLADAIARLREQADHVVVSVHWGEERFRIPSPHQVEQARALAQAGASLILGHHPHVIQGVEVHSGVPIVYSLGNSIACDVPFSDGDVMTWDRTERTGCLLIVELGPHGVSVAAQRPTFDDGRVVEVDPSGFGRRCIARTNRAVARGITLGRYRREAFRVKVMKPVLGHLRWSRLRQLRWRHVRRALAAVVRSLNAE